MRIDGGEGKVADFCGRVRETVEGGGFAAAGLTYEGYQGVARHSGVTIYGGL